ncbi:hypothetical protein F5148DRAFT_980975 [Russula earlei]|uniref:Uncharacterized protein n=1 Tax=Russula earlei TaxID=71964 RepID=A0ACC0U860_9AGAM|nr:hypothetical protein F5148DRAFT_980975 [Russula earlei]
MSRATLACLRVHNHLTRLFPRRRASSGSRRGPELVKTDECAIPLKPTWSVDDLLSSFPRPTISSPALRKLHVLSALIPPEEGTPEHAKLTRELEDLVKLVESVRLSKAPGTSSSVSVNTAVDSRVWAEGTGIDLQKAPIADGDREALDRVELLSQASCTENGFYVIHSDWVTKKSALMGSER